MDFYRFRLPGFERTFAKIVRNKGFVVNVTLEKKSVAESEEDYKEISELTRSAEIHGVGGMSIYLPRPSPRYLIREGKLNEIKEGIRRSGANILIFNIDLSPSQAGNIEDALKIPVVDRAGLILEIFGRRAKSKEGKLQVELAQLRYALPRIGGLGAVMSRLGGGIGSRGPGEQELEKDRRKIRRRIQQVKDDLKRIEKHRHLIRSGRGKKGFTVAALVGYTNAGKSTLLNALTGADAFVEDKLFATLDPKTRLMVNGRNQKCLFVDTVGFIQDLPHDLVESFHATLEEVTEADILIHVVDVSHPRAAKFKECVEDVLAQIEAQEIPRILVLNKSDLLDESAKKETKSKWPEGILVSAKDREGLEMLAERLQTIKGRAQSNASSAGIIFGQDGSNGHNS